MLNRILERMLGGDSPACSEDGPLDRRPSDLVLSLPSTLQNSLVTQLPRVCSTDETFRALLESAKRSIKIFSPYVDNSFTGMAQVARAPIQIVTTLRDAKMKSSLVLERFATTRPLAVRYLCEKQGKSQLYQLHAKMILSDGERAYVGSANFTDTSLHYNFELGLYLEDRDAISRLNALFDYVFDHAAKPAGQL